MDKPKHGELSPTPPPRRYETGKYADLLKMAFESGQAVVIETSDSHVLRTRAANFARPLNVKSHVRKSPEHKGVYYVWFTPKETE